MKTLVPLLVLVPAFLMPSAAAPRDAIHLLTDGTAVEGAARVSRAEVRIVTPFGTRTLPREDYRGVSQVSLDALASWYRTASSALNKRDIAGRRRLAEECRAKGYLTGLRKELNVILASDTDDRWTRMVVGSFARDYVVHRFEAERKGGKVRKYIDFLFEKLAVRDNVGAVLAGEKLRAVHDRELVYRPAMKALKHTKPRVRWLGAHLLAGYTGKPARIQNLFRRSLQDGVWAVRREAVRSLRVVGDSSMTNLYAGQLGNPANLIKLRSAQALGELGFKEAAEPLVKALADTWRPNRVHIASLRQRAYVKDYDVEVAQTAFIADPVVDVLQEGSILDVGLISVSIVRRAYRGARARVPGGDLGADPKAWRKHLDGK